MYFAIKTLHVVFVIAWMGAVFYLPRILVNLAESDAQAEVRQRLSGMGRRLYRFGHIMFGLAVVCGLLLWFAFHVSGGWLHAKIALVVLMFVHYVVGGRWLKRMEKGRALPSGKALRWFNELPVLLLVVIVYLVIAKPF